MKSKPNNRILSFLVAAMLVIGLLPVLSVPAQAAEYWEGWAAIAASTSGRTLSTGNYRVTGNTSISNSTVGGNGITISASATVTIYIPSGYTLTVTGGAGSGTTGGGAGVYLQSGATLIVRGSGTLSATGGKGGNAGNGGTGGSASHNTSTEYFTAGYGGSGGNGGGGGGAGIGTNGASGGSGASQRASRGAIYTTDGAAYNGYTGNSGTVGGTSSAAGTLYVLDTAKVTGAAGGAGSAGSNGSNGSGAYQAYTRRWFVGGGGGGGGGAAGGSGAGIGAGGYGGGGGGSGGSGGYNYNSSNSGTTNPNGGSGQNGSSTSAGNAGTTSSYVYTITGGTGGSGGGNGSSGGNGTVYKATGATVSGASSTTAPTTYIITYNTNGGHLGTVPSTQTKYSGIAEYITDEIPARTGYNFAGWNTASDGTGTDYAAGATYTANAAAILYAKWTPKKQTTVKDNTDTQSGFAVLEQSNNLDTVFDRVVSADELANSETVTLSLNVTDIGGQTDETEAIKQLADKGNEVYFFDVTLTKQINTGTPEPLTNIPVPVEVHIKLTGNLAGKAYYKVYRYHNGIAEQIANDPAKAEHYTVDVGNSEIIIHTMKFSTYAIFGNDVSLQDLTNGEDMDVQAKIADGSIGMYKVDISWGAMTFEWNSSGETYNPDTHEYEAVPGNGVWTDTSHNGENNRIVCANHSNGSLLATFDVTGTLGGIAYNVYTNNAENGTPATDIPLGKVPAENDPAPEIEAYLWLSGEPDSAAMAVLSNVWQKIGVITVTFTPDTSDIAKTPKN